MPFSVRFRREISLLIPPASFIRKSSSFACFLKLEVLSFPIYSSLRRSSAKTDAAITAFGKTNGIVISGKDCRYIRNYHFKKIKLYTIHFLRDMFMTLKAPVSGRFIKIKGRKNKCQQTFQIKSQKKTPAINNCKTANNITCLIAEIRNSMKKSLYANSQQKPDGKRDIMLSIHIIPYKKMRLSCSA